MPILIINLMEQSQYCLIEEARNINKRQKQIQAFSKADPVNTVENSSEDQYNDREENSPIIEQPAMRVNLELEEQWSPLQD